MQLEPIKQERESSGNRVNGGSRACNGAVVMTGYVIMGRNAVLRVVSGFAVSWK